MALSLATVIKSESVSASEKSCCFQSHMVFFMALFDLTSESFSAFKASMLFCWFADRAASTRKDPTRHTFITVLLFAAFVAAATSLFANSIPVRRSGQRDRLTVLGFGVENGEREVT